MNFERIANRTIWWIGLIFCIAFWCAMWAFIGIATAHQAIPSAAQPYGWQYPITCCSGQDCAAISGVTVKERPDGYYITLSPEDHQMIAQTTTFHIPYGDTKIKDSPDGEFHICISRQFETPDKSATMGGNVLCFFVPPRSF